MSRIQTYVFIDFETTGLPKYEFNKTRITELSMVAVKRQHLLDTRPGATPRVQHKLTLCLNPRRMIADGCTAVTGLDNYLLEHESDFNKQVFTIIDTFLSIMSQPVCLIAQNGLSFDYPILQNHLVKLKVNFTVNVLCADCYHGFYHILEKIKKEREMSTRPEEGREEPSPTNRPIISQNNPKISPTNNTAVPPYNETNLDEIDFQTSNISMQAANEITPKCNKTRNMPLSCSKAKRKLNFPWGDGPKPKDSYKLKNIYERVLNKPGGDAHRAENDCMLAMGVSVALSKQFVEWVDKNHMKFSDVEPMTIGVPMWPNERTKSLLGWPSVLFRMVAPPSLLTLTGVLWGCTNPFIKQGTKGLRDVRSNTWAGQAWAEVAFLMGNWRYVVPWLVNQCGSLAYLLAVQRAPLSVAVPVANGLAFAFTAVTGAISRAEEPLHAGSVLGVVLIVVGTALCCWDKAP